VITFVRLLKGATDKIRQAGSGMPAVLIHQLENLGKLRRVVHSPQLRETVDTHARLLLAAGEQTVRSDPDRADIRAAFDATMYTVDPDAADWASRLARTEHGTPVDR
jgi:uncharacterized membrane protein